jgi:hypothetical protein
MAKNVYPLFYSKALQNIQIAIFGMQPLFR